MEESVVPTKLMLFGFGPIGGQCDVDGNGTQNAVKSNAACPYTLLHFTFTHDPSSLGATPANPPRMEAPAKCCLIACAAHIGENGPACPSSKEGSSGGPHSSTQPQLSADNLSIVPVPSGIADSAPGPSVVLLHTTLKASATTC